ncbi:MAG: hypothetical protein WCF36_10215 [Candidatus Nanopelagicales bacterium]
MDVVLAVIIACEIGSWVLVAPGLTSRYALGRRRVGAVLLALAPVVDLVLLTAVVIDLRAGATAHFSHGLAALYIGVSIAYGHSMIRWADGRFAHHFGHGPAPRKLYGRQHLAQCWADVARTGTAVLIAAGIISLLRMLVEDPTRTQALLGVLPLLGIWFAIDALWAISCTLSPRKRPAGIVQQQHLAGQVE